jgi:hypothetical protein
VRLEVERIQHISTDPTALRVTRYGSLDVYALDSSPTMETGGFWIPTERPTDLVVSDHDGNATAIALTLESAAAATARVSRGEWHQDTHLTPGSRTEIVVPASETPRPLRFDISGAGTRQAVWVTVARK